MTEYERLLLAINSGNLGANLENVAINEKILSTQERNKDDRIVELLELILKELRYEL